MNTGNTFDSYIFDMDGTLWDAVDSYCAVWNKTIADLGLDIASVTRARLQGLMGTPLGGIYDALVGDAAERADFNKVLRRNEDEMMPHLGGRLYPGVKSTLEELHRRGARLFMVSNCSPKGLPNFLAFTGLGPLIEDWRSYGANGLEKDANIRELVGCYNLRTPVYIGDTAGDCADTHAAGIPFVWASYGFGHDVTDADYIITDITQLLNLHPAAKQQ